MDGFARNLITNQLLSILRESLHTHVKVAGDPGEWPKESKVLCWPRETFATYQHANVMSVTDMKQAWWPAIRNESLTCKIYKPGDGSLVQNW